jgi:hypothetical protein
MEWSPPRDIERPKRASRKAKNERQRTRLDRLQHIEEPMDGDESRTETAAEFPRPMVRMMTLFTGPAPPDRSNLSSIYESRSFL